MQHEVALSYQASDTPGLIAALQHLAAARAWCARILGTKGDRWQPAGGRWTIKRALFKFRDMDDAALFKLFWG